MQIKLKKILVNIDLFIACFALVVLIAITILGVLMRYFANNPLAWLEEIQMMSIVWLTFFGGSVAFRLKSHVAIEVIVDLFSKRAQFYIRLLVALTIVIALSFIVINGAKLVFSLHDSERLTSILLIPYAIVYAAVPIGSLFMIINFLMSESSDIFTRYTQHKE